MSKASVNSEPWELHEPAFHCYSAGSERAFFWGAPQRSRSRHPRRRGMVPFGLPPLFSCRTVRVINHLIDWLSRYQNITLRIKLNLPFIISARIQCRRTQLCDFCTSSGAEAEGRYSLCFVTSWPPRARCAGARPTEPADCPGLGLGPSRPLCPGPRWAWAQVHSRSRAVPLSVQLTTPELELREEKFEHLNHCVVCRVHSRGVFMRSFACGCTAHACPYSTRALGF